MTIKKKMIQQQLQDGFTAMAIEDIKEIEYTRGAASGLLHPSGIAKHYCGIKEPTVGNIMAYGFRRFGYPINGWDDYKQLCRWIIRTPIEGVFLTLQPSSISPFGYSLKDPLSQRLYAEQSCPFIEWGKKCRQWAKTTYGIVLIDQCRYAGHYNNEEAETEYCKWLKSLGKLPSDELVKQFIEFKSEECLRLIKEYEQIEPIPERQQCDVWDENVSEVPFWESLPADSLERNINQAIYRTILDMLRPVAIRDWQINIQGECAGEDFRTYVTDEDGYGEIAEDYFSPVSKHAGYGISHLSKLMERK